MDINIPETADKFATPISIFQTKSIKKQIDEDQPLIPEFQSFDEDHQAIRLKANKLNITGLDIDVMSFQDFEHNSSKKSKYSHSDA
jgi:hypothetical protein